MYPASREDLERAKANAVKTVYKPEVRDMIVKAMQHQQRVKALAAVHAQILKTMIVSIAQKKGKPKYKLVIELGKVILGEFKIIAEKMRIKLSQQELQQIGKLAGDIVQQSLSNTPPPNQQNAVNTVPERGILQSAAAQPAQPVNPAQQPIR